MGCFLEKKDTEAREKTKERVAQTKEREREREWYPKLHEKLSFYDVSINIRKDRGE